MKKIKYFFENIAPAIAAILLCAIVVVLPILIGILLGKMLFGHPVTP